MSAQLERLSLPPPRVDLGSPQTAAAPASPPAAEAPASTGPRQERGHRPSTTHRSPDSARGLPQRPETAAPATASSGAHRAAPPDLARPSPSVFAGERGAALHPARSGHATRQRAQRCHGSDHITRADHFLNQAESHRNPFERQQPGLSNIHGRVVHTGLISVLGCIRLIVAFEIG